MSELAHTMRTCAAALLAPKGSFIAAAIDHPTLSKRFTEAADALERLPTTDFLNDVDAALDGLRADAEETGHEADRAYNTALHEAKQAVRAVWAEHQSLLAKVSE